MTRPDPVPTNRRTLLAAAAGAITVTLAATVLTVNADPPRAAAQTTEVLSHQEIAAGVVALSESYPGGLPALVNLFDTGECAGAEDYANAPAACRSVLDQVNSLGAGQPAPVDVPPATTEDDQTVPEQQPADSLDQITPEMIEEMRAEGFPEDLLAGLSADPPYLPPAYNTLPNYQGGGIISPPSSTTVPVPTTDTTAPTVPTDPTSTTGPTTTVPTTTGPTTTTWTTTTAPTTTWSSTTPPSTTTPPSSTSSSPPPTSSTPPSSTTSSPPPTTTSPTTTTTTPTTTTTTTTPPTSTTPPPPPLLVAVGDSVTSGHEARPGPPFGRIWRTTCDDPGVNAAAPGSSWAGLLRGLVGVPWNRYFNYAHSGASTADVLATVPYMNPCGVASQPVRPQIGDATAVLAANPSRPGKANVAVVTAGINDTNWVAVATQLVSRRLGGAIAGLFGAAPGWAVANRASCSDWVHGNPRGNPGAPPGAVPPAWNGVAVSGGITGGSANIALSLIGADPGAQVRHLLYYSWIGDPNLPAVCTPAALRATALLNGWINTGILVARIVWAFMGGNPNRIQAVCPLLWNPAAASIQTRLISFGIPNRALLPGWPHPNAGGRGALAACVNGTLPRAAGGGIA